MAKAAHAAILILIGSLGTGLARQQSAWTDSLRIRFDTTPAGADVAKDVTAFPVLIRLSAPDFDFSKARPDGADLRFAGPDGADLPFEIERFDPDGGAAEIWVRMPKVIGNSATQYITMRWGNPDATQASSGPWTFAAGDGFAGAWHLGEAGASAAGGFKDATAHGNHGTGNLLVASSTAEAVSGLGCRFKRFSNQGIFVPHSESLKPSGDLTVEAWIRIAVPAAYTRFIGKANLTEGNAYGFEAELSGSRPGFNLTLSGAQQLAMANTVMANGVWYHLAGTWDGNEQRIYVNGVLENAIPRAGDLTDYGQPLAFGRHAFNHFVNLEGDLDEPRISRVARSPHWIKLAYANQKGERPFVRFEKVAGCPAAFVMPADTVVDEGANLVLSASVRCGVGYNWTVLSGPAPRILDPEQTSLAMTMPRVAGDAVILYRFSADVAGVGRTGEVRVTVREAIPDPEFLLDPLPPWTSGNLDIIPVITNAAALRQAQAPPIRYAWTLQGLAADTVMLADGLRLFAPQGNGHLVLGVCLDNGGARACKSITVEATGATGLKRAEGRRGKSAFGWIKGNRGLDGRVHPRTTPSRR